MGVCSALESLSIDLNAHRTPKGLGFIVNPFNHALSPLNLLHPFLHLHHGSLRRHPQALRPLHRLPSCCRSPFNDVECGLSSSKSAELSVSHFTWSSIESATDNFNPLAIIGEGGFSTVYLAHIPSSTLAAVKVYHNSSCSDRIHRAFLNELAALRRARHTHIVRLLGYSDDCGKAALLFEHVSNGSLHDRLHGPVLLTWSQRMSIVFKLAVAVDYLHNTCDPQIVHGDLTSSNVLLDGKLSPKLCDFGSAEMGFSAAVRSAATAGRGRLMVGSPGYVDPHYMRTGLVSKKSDVYSFGVLLLEMITGVPAYSPEGRMLAAEMGPRLAEKKVAELVDPSLGVAYDGEEAATMMVVAGACIGEQPSLRPYMGEVVRVMRENVRSSISTVERKSYGGYYEGI